MKGIGKSIITCVTACGGHIDLVGFLDGSASVKVDDRTVGVWEPFEIDDAIAAYWGRVGIRKEIARDEVSAVLLLASSAAIN